MDIENEIRSLRARLHLIPEASLEEVQTRALLKDYLRTETELELTDCGSWFYAVWPGTGRGRQIALRADFDAVRGKDGKPGHYCGHDGHSAVLAGFGKYLSELRPDNTVILLFQPAEETGKGAAICCGLFRQRQVDEIYGFHNIPGAPEGAVLLTEGTFACASTGLEIRLTGSPSHAAYPDAGRNPARAISKLVLYMNDRIRRPHESVLLGTVIGIDLGGSAYGMSAGEGILRVTLRAEKQDEFSRLLSDMRSMAEALAEEDGLQCSLTEVEPFPSTENHPECTARLRRAAEAAGLQTSAMAEPMRWSEDFGAYLQQVPGAFFGLGDGEDWPQLHTEAFCFPDAIIRPAVALYTELVK